MLERIFRDGRTGPDRSRLKKEFGSCKDEYRMNEAALRGAKWEPGRLDQVQTYCENQIARTIAKNALTNDSPLT